MFSNFIQNMLNGGGQAAAMQRYAQIHQKVNASNAQAQVKNPLDTIYPANASTDIKSLPGTKSITDFEKILQSSTKANFGSLLMNPEIMKVKAQLAAQNDVEEVDEIPDLSSILPAGSVARPANLAQPTSKAHIMNMVSKISQKHGVDENLVKALIKQESGFNPKATSKAGAMGLMQLMPSTAKGLGVKDAYNPAQNVDGGVRYLKSMLDKYNGNVVLALAAYNAGPGAVDKYGSVPPYAETQNYVKSILANYL